MAGIVTSNKTRKLVGNRLKEIDVPTTTLNTALFYADLTAQGAGYTAARVNAELNAYPTVVKNNASLALTPSANKAGVVYAMNGDSKTLEEFEFQRGSSGTYFDASGVMQLAAPNVPRINYENGVAKGLMIEPSSSNLATDSGLDATAGNIDLTWNMGALFNKGLRHVWTSGQVNSHSKVISATAGKQYVFSVFVKMDDGSMPIVSGALAARDITLVVFGNARESEIQSVGNGVYRIWYTGESPSTGSATFGVSKYYQNTNKPFTFTGFQIEEGSRPTSYIPTTAIATRLADKVLSKRPTVVFAKNSINVKTAEWPATWMGNGVDNLNITGKNVFNKSDIVSLALNTATLEIANSAVSRSFYFPTTPGEIWSISRDVISNNRLRVVFTSELPKPGVLHFGGINSSLNDNKLKFEGIVAPEGAKFIFVYLSNDPSNIIPKIKIEKSSLSTTYSPNPSEYVKVDVNGNIEISYIEPIHLQQFSLISRELSQEEV